MFAPPVSRSTVGLPSPQQTSANRLPSSPTANFPAIDGRDAGSAGDDATTALAGELANGLAVGAPGDADAPTDSIRVEVEGVTEPPVQAAIMEIETAITGTSLAMRRMTPPP
jgi:hypothetical protein